MGSQSEASSRAASEGLPEPGGDEKDKAYQSRTENESIVTDLPVMHTAKRLKVEARKLDGMQRELYNLIGDNQPPVVVTPGSKFKTKPEWQQRAAPWKFVEFQPKDSLTLKHWVRAAALADGTAGYRFARFNTPINVPDWSDEDYQLFERESWTIEETRYLFELAKEYDLRWLVIGDRYSWETPRSLEDLKERYYEVCSALVKFKPVSAELGLSPFDEELLRAMRFDKEQEEARKAHLERLLSRNPKEVAEEEALILEARRLESMSDRILSERRDLMKLLESPQTMNSKTSRSDLGTSQGIGQFLLELQNEKSRKTPTPAPAAAATAAGVSSARKSVADAVQKVLNRKVTSREESAVGISYIEPGKIKHPGVYLRSSKLTPIRQNLLPKIRTITNELGLPLRPVMPTAEVCGKYELLYQMITLLLEAKKVQDKLELEIEVLKRAREAPTANGPAPQGAPQDAPQGASVTADETTSH